MNGTYMTRSSGRFAAYSVKAPGSSRHSCISYIGINGTFENDMAGDCLSL